jgi:hypothetical protein
VTTRKKAPPWYQAHCERLLVAMAETYEAMASLLREGREYVAMRSDDERRLRALRTPPTQEEEDGHIAKMAAEAAELGADIQRLVEEAERGEPVAAAPEK